MISRGLVNPGVRICNMCGKHLDVYDVNNDFTIAKKKIGYGSFYEGESTELRLCNKCFDNIAAGCEIPPFLDVVRRKQTVTVQKGAKEKKDSNGDEVRGT